jgi:hypothetical protein
MDRSTVVSPIELSVLTQAVDLHCAKHGIKDEFDKENIAAKAIQIFRSGTTELDEIQARLEATDSYPLKAVFRAID